jgi:hypothetical protein
MKPSVIVWDLETVTDLGGFAACQRSCRQDGCGQRPRRQRSLVNIAGMRQPNHSHTIQRVRASSLPETDSDNAIMAVTHLSPQYDQLMSERSVLCLKSALRLERRYEQGQEPQGDETARHYLPKLRVSIERTCRHRIAEKTRFWPATV